jgi:site-specific recombinase XerD
MTYPRLLGNVVRQIDNKEHCVWGAIVSWRKNIYKSDLYSNSKSNYLTSMLKLIESGIIDIRIKLNAVNDTWINESKLKIDAYPHWSLPTKTIRKSCLNSFYKFIQSDFDRTVKPYRRHPKLPEIKHILSITEAKSLTENISPIELCNALSKINERDAYIVWLMMHTGQTLEAILELPKRKEDDEDPYLRFKDINPYIIGEHIPEHIIQRLNELCKNSKTYLFETTKGKRIRRTQVTRNLKQAGKKIGLTYDLTPKVLQGGVCAVMAEDKRSELEKALGFSID